MASPKPCPGICSSRRKPRCPSCSFSALGTPKPSSVTLIVAKPWLCSNDSSTTLLDHLPALSSRLPMISLRSCSSMGQRVSSLSLVESSNDLSVYIRPNIQRSEEHTSELQSRPHLVCRLLLEKKKKKKK